MTPETSDPSRIFPAPGTSPWSCWFWQGAAPPERPARCCGCQARRPRAGAPMGFSMTASGPGRLCSRRPWPACAPGFFQGSTGAWRSRLRAPAQPPGPLSESRAICRCIALYPHPVPRACGLSPMIEHKVGGHHDPRASVLRDGAGFATSPSGRLHRLTEVRGRTSLRRGKGSAWQPTRRLCPATGEGIRVLTGHGGDIMVCPQRGRNSWLENGMGALRLDATSRHLRDPRDDRKKRADLEGWGGGQWTVKADSGHYLRHKVLGSLLYSVGIDSVARSCSH